MRVWPLQKFVDVVEADVGQVVPVGLVRLVVMKVGHGRAGHDRRSDRADHSIQHESSFQWNPSESPPER